MSVLSPWGLLGLVAVPVLIALSLWRRRRREVVASSLLLWRQVAEERRRAPASRRRRRVDPLLVLRVAIALLLTGALGGLAWRVPWHAQRRYALVVDRSASLAAAHGEGRTRWEACREALGTLLGAEPMRGKRLAHLVLVPALGAPAFQDTLDLSDLQGVLRRTGPLPVEVPPDELRAAARRAAGQWPQAQLVVASDRLLEGLPEGAVQLACGGPTDNRGIVAFAARQRPDGAHEVLVRVRNAAEAPAAVEVALLADGAPLGRRRLDLPPRGQAQAVFEARLAEAVALEARLAGRDALAADDRAWLARRQDPVRVALVGEASLPLRRALAAAGEVQVVEFLEPPPAAVPAGCALAVYHRAVPRRLDGGTVAVVMPGAPVGQLRPEEGTVQAPLAAIERRDPLMRSVELADVRPGPVARVSVPPGFQTLARAGAVPVIGRWREGATELVYVGIPPDPAVGDWALRPAFPIFWANVVASVAGGGRGRFRSARPGELCRLPHLGDEAELRGPAGEPLDGASPVFRPQRVGLYRAEPATGPPVLVAASLLSEAETLEAGGGQAAVPEERPAPPGTRAAALWHLGGGLAALALLLLLVHGWLASRQGPGP